MDQQTQIRLIERAVRHEQEGTTDAAAQAKQFPLDLYVDELRFGVEKEVLFGRLPLVVAFSDQLKQPGDYVAHDWSGSPVVICRQSDGSLKAFLNICRHRGTRIALEQAGHVDKQFVCRYHSWSYDLGGQLCGVPSSTHFAAMDKSQNGLWELPIIEWAGLVFMAPRREPESKPDWEDYLTELDGLGLADFEIYAAKTVFAKINWKMMIEANQESYHINFLHRDTAGPRYTAKASLFDTLGPNTRTVLLHKHFSAGSLGPEPAEWRVLQHGDLVYFLFPNTLILLSTLAAHVLTAFPQAVDRTVVRGVTLVPRGTTANFPRAYYDKYWATILEDISVSEPIQVAASAQPALELWLGANECLLDHFHDSIERACANASRRSVSAYAQARCASLGSK